MQNALASWGYRNATYDVMGKYSLAAPSASALLSAFFCSNGVELLQVCLKPTMADASFDAFNKEFYAYNSSGNSYYRDTGSEGESGHVSFAKAAQLFELILDHYAKTGDGQFPSDEI